MTLQPPTLPFLSFPCSPSPFLPVVPHTVPLSHRTVEIHQLSHWWYLDETALAESVEAFGDSMGITKVAFADAADQMWVQVVHPKSHLQHKPNETRPGPPAQRHGHSPVWRSAGRVSRGACLFPSLCESWGKQSRAQPRLNLSCVSASRTSEQRFRDTIPTPRQKLRTPILCTVRALLVPTFTAPSAASGPV